MLYLPQASFSAPHTPPHGQTVLAFVPLGRLPSPGAEPPVPGSRSLSHPSGGQGLEPSPRHVVKSSNQICTALDLSSGFSDV